MALTVDGRARREIVHRQQRGRDATLLVRVARAGVQEYLVAGWAEGHGDAEGLAPLLDGVAVRMDARVAAYTRGHPLTVSAWRWGPFARLVVVDEPLVTLDLEDWERRLWYAATAREACSGRPSCRSKRDAAQRSAAR